MSTATAAGLDRRPDWLDDRLFPFTSRFAELDGTLVHYVDEGAGPTLLMLHGNPGWSFTYREAILALRHRFRCVALDLPGFGLSHGAPGYGYRAADHAALLVAVLDHLGLERATLVGQSWGGPLGLHATLERPGTFDRLVLANTWAWPLNGDPSSELFARTMGSPLGRLAVKRFNLLTGSFLPMAHRRRRLSTEELEHYRAATATPTRRHAGAMLPGQLVGARPFFTDLAARLGALEGLPTLLVWGDTDPIFTARYRERLEAAFPDHTTTVLHGAGHLPQSDAPAEFSAAIERWWAPPAP